jgi:hypothetical protein
MVVIFTLAALISFTKKANNKIRPIFIKIKK